MSLDQPGPGLLAALIAAVLLTITRRALLPPPLRGHGRVATGLLFASVVAKLAAILAGRAHAKHAVTVLDFVDDLLLGLGVSGLIDVVLFDAVIERLGGRAPRILRDILQAAVFFAIVIGLLGTRGVDVFALATTSAVVTAVVGLALQGTIANLFAGLSMQLDRSFSIGDWIRVGDRVGRIAQIKWRSTSVVTIDGDVLVIPNGQLTANEILNYSGPSRAHREWLRVAFHYRHPPNEVKGVLLDAIRGTPGVLEAPAPDCVPRDFGDSSITYALLYWIDDMGRQVEVEGEVRTRLWYAAKRAGLEIPYPIQTVRVSEVGPELDTGVGSPAERSDRLELLRKVELLAPLGGPERELLAERMRRKRYAAGERMIRQGEPGDSLFLIHDGEVEVLIRHEAGEHLVACLGPGELVGEMSLMTGEPRAATCTAKTDVIAYELDHEAFQLLLEARPELVDELSRTLGARALMLSAEAEQLSAEAAQRQREESSRLKQRILAFFQLG